MPSATSSASIREVAQKMVDERVSAMLITDENGVCGIVTDRDIRTRVVAQGLQGDAPVTRIMSPAPIMLDADAHAYEAALLMMQHHIHHLPITAEGELVGAPDRGSSASHLGPNLATHGAASCCRASATRWT